MEKEKTNLKNEKIKLEGEIAELKDQLEKLNLTVYAEKSAKEEVGRELTKISDETVALREEREALKAELTKLRAENDKMISKEESLSRRGAALMAELEGTKNEMLNLRAVNNILDKTRAENESLKKKLDDADERCIVLENENAALRAGNAEIAAELDSCKFNLTTARNDLDKCENLRSKLCEEIDDLRELLGDAEMRIRFLEGQLADLSNEGEKIEKDDAKAEAEAAKARADDARKQLDDLIKDLDAEKTGRNARFKRIKRFKGRFGSISRRFE